MKVSFSLALPSVAITLLVCACSAPPAGTTAPPPGAAGKTVDAATAGSIAGTIKFTGTAPARDVIKMGSDPGCVQNAGPNPQSDALLVSSDGALQNVFVYLKDGLDPAYTFEAPATPIILDQKGCVYAPRVLGVRVGQSIEIENTDPTFHNVHALPKTNREFNRGLNPRDGAMRQTFTAPEVMVRFKCDVHGWMAAWVGVVAHPFFAVTGPDGSFILRGVPPGKYTVEAWHERLGTKIAQVTVGDHEAQTVAFAFAAN